MKSLLLLPLAVLPLLTTGCETRVVERHPRHVAYVERDVVVDHHRRGDYVDRDVVVERPGRRRDVVVVEPHPFYGPAAVNVRYYTDSRGRYYFRNGHRVYVNNY